MATLPRPGVEISQEIITESPTILTPSLVPCLIGPCFQIVKPLTDDGSLNAEAQSSISAVLSSDSALGEELNLSGRAMVLNINGTGDQTVNFPTTIDNATLSQSLVENTINKQLTGAVAEFIENKLVIRTAAKGPTASIKVIAVDSDSAYGSGDDDILAMNSLVGTTLKGKTSYTNTSYTIPYSSFPSPKTDVSEIVIDKDALDAYIYYDKTLRLLSEDSAPAINAFHVGTTKIGNGDISIAHQPALTAGSGLVSLYGKPLANGSKTNVLAHPGTEASLTLPLCHDTAPNATPSTLWPDVTGGNSLSITCIGKSTFLSTGNVEDMGSIDGQAGNAIEVEINAGAGAGLCTASYVGGTLTISGSDSTKHSAIASALSGAAFQAQIAGVLELSLSQSADEDSICDFTSFAGTYYLGGGSDPVNFSADAGDDADGNSLSKAYVCGTTNVGASTASALGIAGETLSISIDGAEPIDIVLAAADSVLDSINTALAGVGSAAAIDAKNSIGESLTGLLQISTASESGHDSTIEVSASSSKVIAKLFAGASSIDSETLSITPSGSGQSFSASGGTDYNSGTQSALMQAIQPQATTINVTGALAMAGVLLDSPDLSAVGAGDYTLSVKVDGAAAAAIVLTQASCDTLDNTVSHLNTQLGATTLKAMRINSGSQILIFNPGAAGSSIELVAADTADELRAAWPGVYDNEVSSQNVALTIADSGEGAALTITEISNGMSHIAASEAAAAAMDLSMLIGDASVITYSNGDMTIAFLEDAEVVGPAEPATIKVSGGTAASISFTRVWPNDCQPSTPNYTGRVFQGMSDSVAVSDSLLNEGQMVGRIVAIEGFSAGDSSYDGAQLVVSEFGVDNKTFIDGWYVRAENLVAGDGRVGAEVSASNTEQSVSIKHGLLRDRNGLPMSNVTAPVYLGYQALRKDVSADTANPQLLVFNSASEVDTFIGPIEPANPLAFGMYMAFLNSTNINISAIGVSEVTADAPFGTLEAYAEALDYLEMKEVYALAPLTNDLSVFQKFSQHVTDMSVASAKKERMAICCPEMPTEESPILVESGTMILSPPEGIGGGKYNVQLSLQSEIDQKTLHLAINGKSDANGNPIVAAEGSSYTPDQGIYLDREGDANRYLIVGTPDASTITIETSDVYHPGLSGPGTGGNGDSFFKTGTDAVSALSDWEADGEACTIFVRQAALDTKTTGGRLKICEGLAEVAGGVTGFQNRRLVLVQPEMVGVEFGGMETLVDGHYLCGAIAAMIAQQPPSQPFTNLPMVGFTRPVGSSDKFSDNQMSTAAAGGVYWVIQDVEGGALASRHQLTTDVTSLKTRELSILKSVDYVAKLIRAQIKRFIGRRNITRQLLETVSLGIGGALSNVSGSVVAAATLDSIAQDASNPDSIVVSVSLTPYYPANKISVTIYV